MTASPPLPATERERDPSRSREAILTIAVGCTGGKHRSVVIAEQLAARLGDHGHDCMVFHRDLNLE